MAFESATFRNLQKHRKIEIQFDPRVTTLVGPSRAGKTAIVRGLGLICLNHWNKAYLRHGKKTLIGTLKVDGKTIKRKKGKRLNQYFLGNKALRRDLSGKDVPEEVADLLNVGPENFQKQLDPHFWFLDTPGQVAKNLNKIINLQIIDSTLAAATAEVRRLKTEVEVSRDRLLLAKKKVKEVKWAEEFAADLTELEALEDATRAIRDRIVSLTFCIRNVQSLDRRLDRSAEAMLDAQKLKAAAKQALTLSKQRQSLSKLINQLRKVSKRAKQGVPDLTALNKVRVKADRIAEDRREMEMLVEELKQAKEKECHAKALVQRGERELKKLKTCPLCRQPVSSPATFTCGTSHQSPVQKKGKNGTRSRSGI